MKREYFLLAASTTLSLIVGLAVVRIFEPHLFGVPTDMEVVRLSKEVPAFFDNVFRKEDFESERFLLNDPLLITRGKPLVAEAQASGPHDILGFRNRAVPVIADVIALGDSQTYGVNVAHSQTWLSLMEDALRTKVANVYNMALGSWGAVQYRAIFAKALAFQPRVVVVAFYTGNDAHESFKAAYSIEQWAGLRLNPKLTLEDLPKIKRISPNEKTWDVLFKDGSKTSFQPERRLIANNTNSPAIKVGFQIMARVARDIASKAAARGVKAVFTIIPTKELVYEKRLLASNVQQTEEYRQLIEHEKKNISYLTSNILAFEGATYVDIVEPLQNAALDQPLLYPPDMDGHPLQEGHIVIARTLIPHVEPALRAISDGVYVVPAGSNETWYYLLRRGKLWRFYSKDVLESSGWKTSDLKPALYRDMARFPLSAVIAHSDPGKYGPAVAGE